MQKGNSFTEYVKNTFDNQFWDAAGEYIENDWEPQWEHKRLHKIGANEIEDVKVVHVWAIDKPGMQIKFDVLIRIELTIYEGDYHYDNSDSEVPMIIAHCEGDLDKNLEDFRITSVEPYSGCYRKKEQNELDDSLVLVMGKDDLDRYAESFLQQYYPEALLKPCKIDPIKLAANLGLTIIKSKITADGSIFGRCFFEDCVTEIYDEETKTFVRKAIKAGTIIVDPNVAFMRTIGSFNNTVVHECVHWAFHKKAFALARLYDENLSNVSCEISGGVPGHTMGAVDWMEWQANALAPRIQMPASMFKLQADRLVSQYRRIKEGYDVIDLIEPMINQLADEFGVSKIAAKIRLIDVGYDEAQGAMVYVDEHYVRPYRTGVRNWLRTDQTFTISSQDVTIQILTNAELRIGAMNGLYQLVENHVVYNSPVFIRSDESGKLMLTHYARNHMEECCLPFDLTLKGKYGEHYKTECFLNLDPGVPVKYTISYKDTSRVLKPEKIDYLKNELLKDEQDFCKTLSPSFKFGENLEKGMHWCEDMQYKYALIVDYWAKRDKIEEMHSRLSYKEIAIKMKINKKLDVDKNELKDRTGFDPDTIGRYFKGTRDSKQSLILLCMVMHLPPKATLSILEGAGYNVINTGSDDDYCYFTVITVLYRNSLEEINAYLEANNVKPLRHEVK